MFRSNNQNTENPVPSSAPALNSYSPTAQAVQDDKNAQAVEAAAPADAPAPVSAPAPDPTPIPEPADIPEPVVEPQLEPVISVPEGPPPVIPAPTSAIDPSTVPQPDSSSDPADDPLAQLADGDGDEAPVIAIPDALNMPDVELDDAPEEVEEPAAKKTKHHSKKHDDSPSIDKPGQKHAGSVTGSEAEDLLGIKVNALKELAPLINELDQTPSEKFKITMMLIQATDDDTMVQTAYDAAHAIEDEKERAQALLDVVNEINYFTQSSDSDDDN